ncbi:MAG TPA: alpha/beta hydrolase [Candidatus Saccharimonadales bacterium]|nr:alpha/beta hydrolase [Candidatus Saccharimonadales bacterium]
MQVLVEDSIISYQDIGKKDGKVILFLHGWADESSNFKALASVFSDNYRCIIIDLPGFGGSEIPKEPLYLPDFSRKVAKFLVKIRTRPYAVIGHSNGGAIAINAISGNEISPKKLVLLASSGIRSGQSFKKTALKLLAKPAKASLIMVPAGKRKGLKRKLYARIGSDYMVAENMKDTFKHIVSYDISADAASLDLPVLLIYGEADKTTPPQMGRRLKEIIKSSRLETIPGAGHFIHLDKKDEVAGLIKGFLK